MPQRMYRPQNSTRNVWDDLHHYLAPVRARELYPELGKIRRRTKSSVKVSEKSQHNVVWQKKRLMLTWQSSNMWETWKQEVNNLTSMSTTDKKTVTRLKQDRYEEKISSDENRKSMEDAAWEVAENLTVKAKVHWERNKYKRACPQGSTTCSWLPKSFLPDLMFLHFSSKMKCCICFFYPVPELTWEEKREWFVLCLSANRNKFSGACLAWFPPQYMCYRTDIRDHRSTHYLSCCLADCILEIELLVEQILSTPISVSFFCVTCEKVAFKLTGT